MRITAAESIVMESLWRDAPKGAEDIIAEIADTQGWSEGTVKTLINRLLTKKAIAAKRDGRRYLYSPKLKRKDYVGEESRNLVDRLFAGNLASLVMHFSEHEKLSAKEVAELKRLIAELDDDR